MYSLTHEAPSPIENSKETKEISSKGSLFGAVPKAKKGLSSKEKKLMTMAKFAKVSVEELKKELNEEESPHPVVSSCEAAPEKGILSFLPSPKNETTMLCPESVLSKSSRKTGTTLKQEDSDVKKRTNSFASDVQNEDDLQNEDGALHGMNGIIPLNPFLSDAESIESSKSKVDGEVDTPLMFKTVYRTKSKLPKRGTSSDRSSESSSHSRVDQVFSSSRNLSFDVTNTSDSTGGLPSTSSTFSSTDSSNSNTGYGYGYGYGYGGHFSQIQYEAFIRRSGMLATAGAASSSSADLLVGFACCIIIIILISSYV